MSYGIPGELLLTDMDGNLRKEYVNFWIERKRSYDREATQKIQHMCNSNNNQSVVNSEEEGILPTSKDVLLPSRLKLMNVEWWLSKQTRKPRRFTGRHSVLGLFCTLQYYIY